MAGFCTPDDVREALQDAELKGDTDTAIVRTRIEAFSRWFANATNSYWYDSGGSITGSNNDIPASSTSASNVRLDVPASPHPQRDHLPRDESGLRYPVTHAGPYARVKLPHPWVQSIDVLNVRDTAGDRNDWVADASISSGVGNEYYLETEGQSSYGRTYLYVDTRAIGPRFDYDSLLAVDYSYGRDWATSEWDDVRQGVASFVAADLRDDSDLVASIPDNGQLVGVQTAHDNLVQTAQRFLGPYLSAL